MTEEELEQKLQEWLYMKTNVGMKYRPMFADQILALFREAGWKSGEEVTQMTKYWSELLPKHCDHSWAYYVPDGYKCTKCGEPPK